MVSFAATSVTEAALEHAMEVAALKIVRAISTASPLKYFCLNYN